MLYFKLFVTFFRMGLFTFGGGYAMLPLLQSEVVEKNNWISLEEILDFYALGQVIPGIIAINTSIFVGYKKAGKKGAFFSAFGFIMPSLIIITLLFHTIKTIDGYPWVQHAFMGIRLSVSALILSTVIKMVQKGVVDKVTAVLFIASATVVFFFKISPIYPILIAVFYGIYVARQAES